MHVSQERTPFLWCVQFKCFGESTAFHALFSLLAGWTDGCWDPPPPLRAGEETSRHSQGPERNNRKYALRMILPALCPFDLFLLVLCLQPYPAPAALPCPRPCPCLNSFPEQDKCRLLAIRWATF